jgi:hypothetical protein
MPKFFGSWSAIGISYHLSDEFLSGGCGTLLELLETAPLSSPPPSVMDEQDFLEHT